MHHTTAKETSIHSINVYDQLSSRPTTTMSLLPTHSAATVRSLLSATPEERENVLRSVGYNIFAFPAGLVTCDFLSDSGTSTMTDVQWAACMVTFHSTLRANSQIPAQVS